MSYVTPGEFYSMGPEEQRSLVLKALADLASRNRGTGMVVTTAKLCRHLFGRKSDLPGRVRQVVAGVLMSLYENRVIALYEPPRRRKGRRYLVTRGMLPCLIRLANGKPAEPGRPVSITDYL